MLKVLHQKVEIPLGETPLKHCFDGHCHFSIVYPRLVCAQSSFDNARYKLIQAEAQETRSNLDKMGLSEGENSVSASPSDELNR